MYSCTCLDASLHATVCKHMHLVHMTTTFIPTTHTEDDKHNNTFLDFSSMFPDVSPQLSTREKTQRKINELSGLLANCDNEQAFKAANTHIQAAIMVVKALKQQQANRVLPQKLHYAPNTNSTTQPRFFSTKKKTYPCVQNGKTFLR